MRYCTAVCLACIVAVVAFAMPGQSRAGTCANEALTEDLANASNMTDAQRAALHERLRLLDALAKAKPMPMRYLATPGRAKEGPGALIRFDPATHLATRLESKLAPEAGIASAPGSLGTGLPAFVMDGGDGFRGNAAEAINNSCAPPSPALNTWGYPWRTVVKLVIRFNVGGIDYFYSCSAATVHPFHLLSAGHCVFSWDPNGDGNKSDAKWADEIWAWPAQTDLVDPFGCDPGCPVEADFPFGVAKAVYVHSYTGWTEDEDTDHDMAFIALDRRIGDRVGWMGAEAGVETDSLNFDGYPTETPYVPACTHAPYPGYDEDNVVGYSTYRIGLCAYSYGGHSGGPWWRFDGDERRIEGVSSTSSRQGYAEGTLLTTGKFEDLYDTIIPDETVTMPPTDRPELIEDVLDLNAKDLLNNNVCQGTTFQVNYNAYNVGFASTGGSTVDFYLSPNTCVAPTDHLVGSVDLGPIGENTVVLGTATLTAPCGVPTGTYYAGWIMNSATQEYNTDDNSVVISDETITLTETGPPAITVNASGGDVNNSCVFLAPYSAVITDDCGVAVSSIQVSASSLDGQATVGTPTVSLNVVSPTEVRVSGSVQVSAITGCPADVRITVSAQDICGHPTTASHDIQVNDRIAPGITVQVSQSVLLPPNKRLEPIQAAVAVTDNCPNKSWTLQSVVSNEPEFSGGNDLRPDIVDAGTGTADTLFWLRAERLGSGSGRDYTMVYQAMDACGNTAQTVKHVTVPH